MSNPYAPPGESPSDLWFERSNLDGQFLGCVAYGVHLTIFAICMYYFFDDPGTRGQSWFRHLFLLIFVVVIFALGTIYVGATNRVAEDMFINNRAFPVGGPIGWLLTHYNEPTNVLGLATYIIINFLTDGLLLWRTYVVWDSVCVIAFPSVMYLASTVLSVLSVVQAALPNSSIYSATTVQLTVPYFSLSIALNTLLTCLLVGRLLAMARNLRRTIGTGHAYGSMYISVAAMLVESAAPYTITGLVFIIAYARNSNVLNLVLPVLAQVMCINPELIILRVLMGRDANNTSVNMSMTTGQRSDRGGFMSRTRDLTSAAETMQFSSAEHTKVLRNGSNDASRDGSIKDEA